MEQRHMTAQDSLTLEDLKKMTKEELVSLVFRRCDDDEIIQAQHRNYLGDPLPGKPK